MFLFRYLLVVVMLVVGAQAAVAGPGQRGHAAAGESRLETPAPSYSSQVQHALLATEALQDKLRLSTQQVLAFKACTVRELQALCLAATAADIARAERQHLLAAGRILSAWQFQQYLDLRQDFTDHLLFADGPEVASR